MWKALVSGTEWVGRSHRVARDDLAYKPNLIRRGRPTWAMKSWAESIDASPYANRVQGGTSSSSDRIVMETRPTTKEMSSAARLSKWEDPFPDGSQGYEADPILNTI